MKNAIFQSFSFVEYSLIIPHFDLNEDFLLCATVKWSFVVLDEISFLIRDYVERRKTEDN